MGHTNQWKFVTPGHVLEHVKGFRTAAQVKAFAETHDVRCGWWKSRSGARRHFLVEFSSFKKACAARAAAAEAKGPAKKPRRTDGAAPRPLRLHRGYLQSMRAWARIYTSRRAA